MRKPVVGVQDHVRNRAVQPQKMVKGLIFSDIESRVIVLSMKRKQRRLSVAPADLHHYFLHLKKAGFLMTRLIYKYFIQSLRCSSFFNVMK